MKKLFLCRFIQFMNEHWRRFVPFRMVLLVAILLFSSLSAHANLQHKVTILKSKLTLEELFNEVKNQTGLTVIYSNNRLNKNEQVELTKTSFEVDDLLNNVLENKSLTIEFRDDYIIVKPSNNLYAYTQPQQRIKGTVVDEDGLPLPGVSVIFKGTQIGTATGFEGEFDLVVPEGSTTIVVSFIGMITQEINISDKPEITVKLISESSDIDEVVVTGYQKVDRKLFTGSAVKLDAQDIKIEGVADVSRSLQGTVAGVEIENVSGTFGTAPIMRIRGNASIYGTNRPLMVVDGVVMEDAVEMSNEDLTSGNLTTLLSSPTAGINPEDIESFQVLKDASATALYGARAMNGVIVITTKKGTQGKPIISYSTSLTVREKPRYDQFDIMTSGAEMAVYQELYEKGWIDIATSNNSSTHGVMQDMFYKIANDELTWGPNGSLNYDYLQRYADANTDWFDELFKTSVIQQHSLSIAQGSENAKIRASIGIMNDPGQTIADKVKNYTAAIRTDFNLGKKFRLGFKLSGNIRDQKVAASEKRKFNAIDGQYERNFDINPFNYALYTSRSITPRDEDDNLQFFRRNYAPFNIIHEIDNNSVNLDVADLLFQTDFDYNITDKLVFNGTLQGRWYSSKAVQEIHENSNNANAYRADDPLFRDYNRFLFSDEQNPLDPPYSVLPNGGFRKTTQYGLNSYMARFSVNYNPMIHEDHAINLLVGQELRYTDRTDDYNEGWGYVFDKGGLVLSDPDFIKYLDSRGEDYFRYQETYNRFFGAYANAGYSYKGKYIINGTFRYDGDNRTGESRQARYLPTWNVSGAWNLHTESFMSNANWIDVLKLKATYGLSGDNPVGASAAMLIYGKEPLRPHISDRETALYISSLKNEELTFEKLYEFSTGVEFSIFKGRIFTELEYWNRHSVDLLGYVETNGVGGVNNKLGNVGEMKIQGVDFTLNTTNLRTHNFKWDTQFNYSYSTDEITKWYSRDRIGDAVNRTGGNLEGYSRGALFSIPFAGLDSNGIPTFYGKDGETIQKLNLQERNDILNHIIYEGTTTPKGYGGLTNSFTYKNINLSVGLVFRYGNKIRLDDAFYGNYSDYSALPGQLVNRWQFEGDEEKTTIPAIITKQMSQALDDAGLNPYQLYNKSDERVADGDFIRLKNIKLNYRFSNRLLDKTFIKAADVTLSAYNLALLYSDKRLNGIDPEFYQSGGIAMPMARTYTFTLNFKF